MNLALPPPHHSLDLLGQGAAEAALLRAWQSGRLPHGWLFTGRFGAGKATLAFRFTRFLLAGGGDRLALPADHPVTATVAAGAHPDLVHLAPKAGGRGSRAIIDVDSVREALDRVHKTGVGCYRVLLIEQAHALNASSANALLKTLEEPGPGLVIILTADSETRFPATIRSRLARLRLLPVPDAEIMAWLEGRGVAPDAAAALAPLASGSPGLAAWLYEIDALGHYARLMVALDGPGGEAGIAAGLGVLDAMLAVEDAALVRELVSHLLRRAVAQGMGLPLRPLAAEETSVLDRLARRLDRVWEVWDKLAVLDVAAERLSLDRQALLVDIAAALTTAGRPAPT